MEHMLLRILTAFLIALFIYMYFVTECDFKWNVLLSENRRSID